MNRDISELFEEPGGEVDEWARRVIGAAIEVHRALGPGYLESVYENALAYEFELRGIPFSRQPLFDVVYKGRQVGRGKLDFLVGGMLIVELKACEEIGPVQRAQLISYLRANKLKLGLIINFNTTVLKDGVRRVVAS